MEFIVFISYILFAFLLFLFLNFLMKKFSLNKIEYILFSNIFLVVVASFASYFHLATFCDNIFIIIVFEFLIRMQNIIVAYLLNQFIIRQVDMVFLNPEQLKFLLWVFIFIFLYHFLYQGRTSNFKMLVHKQQEIGDKKQYIITQYAKMKQKYGNDIHVKGNLRLLVYAIMIFENNRRPKFFRQLDYFRYQFDHIPKKQGIMQVDSKKIINDVESIEMVEKKLQTKKKTKKSDDSNAQLLKRLGKKANEIEQIEKVYQVIEEFLEL